MNRWSAVSVLLSCAAFAQAQVKFDAPLQFDAGGSPFNHVNSNVTIADFNRDGIPDLASGVGPNVALVLGKPGGLQPVVLYPVTGCALIHSMISGDFNGDGYPDLAVECGTSTAYLLTGGPGGGFAVSPLMLPSTTAFITTGDFNGDGIPDLAFALNPTGIAVLLGTGGGHFGPVSVTSTPVFALYLAAGDFFRAGREDLIVILEYSQGQNFNFATYLYKSAGTGTFTKQQALSRDRFGEVIVADLNGDGLADVILFGSSTLNIYFGDGAGGFSAETQLTTVGQTYSVALADLNGDHIPDLIATNTAGTISVFYGAGNHLFQTAVSYEANNQPMWVGTGRFFASDITDIVTWNVVANLGTAPAYSMIRIRNGAAAAQPVTPVGPASSAGVIADMNRDGTPDMIVPLIGPPVGVAVLAGSGKGTFGPVLGSFAAGVNQLGTPLIADFNRDGLPDIAVMQSQTGNTIYTALQQAGGGYNVVQTTLPWTAGSIVFAGDLNGDHLPDLVVTQSTTPELWVLLGNGDGTFLAPAMASSVGGTSIFADFNGDGKVDLVVASFSGLLFLPGRGDGTFGNPVISSKLALVVMASGDFNGDGKLDVAGTTGSDGLYILFGKGDGTFKQTLADSSFRPPVFLLSADFNGDGKADLLSSGSQVNDLAIYQGLGNGKFVAPAGSYYCVAYALCYPNVVDMNGDGRPDIVSDLYGTGPGVLSTLIQK